MVTECGWECGTAFPEGRPGRDGEMGQEQKGLWGWRAHGTVFRWQRFEPVCTCEVGPTSANKDTCLLFQGLGPQPRGEESPCPPGANRLERQTSTPMRNRRR